ATWPGEFRLSTCWPPTETKARSIFQPDRRSARSTDSAIERTVWSMLTTTPFFRPDEATVPWPITVIRPSRLTSPIRVQTFDVPTPIAPRPAPLSTFVAAPSAPSLSDEMAPDQRHVVEDPQAERDQRHKVEIEAEAVADEGEDDRHDRVRDEPADEDAIVVD